MATMDQLLNGSGTNRGRTSIPTPWGESHSIENIGEGMIFVTTAGHGGIRLDKPTNAMMPEYMRSDDGWYEEDCQWALAVLVLIDRVTDSKLRKSYANGSVLKTVKDWYPLEAERFLGITLQPGESAKKDEMAFWIRNADNWVVSAAFGSWAKGVPAGMVGVVARLGRSHPHNDKLRTERDGAERWFLIPDAEYSERKGNFVIDTAKHKEVPAIKPYG